jgi:hypothetical protein
VAREQAWVIRRVWSPPVTRSVPSPELHDGAPSSASYSTFDRLDVELAEAVGDEQITMP